MDERLASIFQQVEADIPKVAAAALGRASVASTEGIGFEQLTTPHSEVRSIGIVKVSGVADGRRWSSVAKVLNLGLAGDPRIVGVTAPENEEIVYEEKYFDNGELSFRPARCHHISRLSGSIKVLWLEDLTDASGPPFTLDQLAQMARHLGEWNGWHAGRRPRLKFAIGRDFYDRRYKGWGFDRRLAELKTLEDHPKTRESFRDHPVSLAFRLCDLLSRLNEASKALPHALAFGDCAAGNVFFRPGETIAIDWASLSDDPVGVDGGCLIGSSITWGAGFADVAANEGSLFDNYVEGLRAAGWRGERNTARRAYFGQFGFYLGTVATIPVMLTGNVLPLDFLEKRYGMPIGEIALKSAPVIDRLPAYIAEIEALLG